MNNDILLKNKRFKCDKGKYGCDAVKLEFLKQLRKVENINNETFFCHLKAKCNNSGDQYLNTLKHCAAVEMRYFHQLNCTELGLDVILTLLF